MTRFHLLPWRPHHTVQTDAMADTEAASSIPPWPCDIGHSTLPRAAEPDPIEGAGAVVVPLMVLAAVVFFAALAALL